ncbi:hypothetical protein PCH_Pc16g03550 [Penicillium rubens Wisconsin 54-1255]|uniref:Uncharacterized protein n=1 Tax=Penicillium rubens (strain ATCC 28089 / DSM 1075 / NRRL 1951 / Wisconsin 54-1255) TaxID=500485 RepID=B6H7T5_PENRW|nr:hypothetical protein PCH_Pc16g03550 [Penicillium rubens Wisconsin 54-1255]
MDLWGEAGAIALMIIGDESRHWVQSLSDGVDPVKYPKLDFLSPTPIPGDTAFLDRSPRQQQYNSGATGLDVAVASWAVTLPVVKTFTDYFTPASIRARDFAAKDPRTYAPIVSHFLQQSLDDWMPSSVASCARLAAPWSCFTVSEAMPSIGIQFYRLVRNVLPIEDFWSWVTSYSIRFYGICLADSTNASLSALSIHHPLFTLLSRGQSRDQHEQLSQSEPPTYLPT